MSLQKVMIPSLVIGIMNAGCVSDPFIADSLEKLDESRTSAISRFNLPETHVLPIEPLSAIALTGGWESGRQHPCHRFIGRKGLLTDLDADKNRRNAYYHDTYQNYGFDADGKYFHQDTWRMGTCVNSVKEWGRWTYDENSGMLTLHKTKNESEYSDIGLKALGLPNWRSHTAHNLDVVVKYRVVWFAHNEITIEQEVQSHRPPNSRDTVMIDDNGVRTERSITVTGMKDGKEVGTVSEIIYPPLRFKKTYIQQNKP